DLEAGQRVEMEESLGEAHAHLAPVAIVFAVVPGELMTFDVPAPFQLSQAALEVLAHRSLYPRGPAQHTKAQLPAGLGVANEEEGIEIGVVPNLGGQR